MTTNYPYAEPHYSEPQYPEYGGYLPPAPPPAPQRPKRRWVGTAGIAALIAAALVGGVAIGEARSSTDGTGTVAQAPSGQGNTGNGSTGNGSTGNGSTGNGNTGNGSTGNGNFPFPNGQSNGSGQANATVATSAQQKGIVTVVSVLKYQNAESAGTGMVLTSDGEVLTNNHVIDGATSITVTIASTGKSYRAAVVGTAPSKDVAVLQLQNASGLTTANVGDSSAVSVGDGITGVGNAGGTGTLTAATGNVTALDRSITATDESGQDGEKLSGLIEIDAAIISGDSGGPLYDKSGEVIGMDTAASASRTDSTAYAIPINTALKVATQIETGIETTTIHIGLPAFLGVGVADTTTDGAAVTSLLDGGPAAGAGITDGSVITAVGSTQVTSAASLKTALQGYRPGDSATVTWTGPNGGSHTAKVTLGTGPAD